MPAVDRRAKIIRLTESGRTCQATAHRIFAGIEREWGGRFGGARVAAMRELLTEIAAGAARVASPA